MDKVWRRFLLGYLLSAVLMVPIGYLILQVFPLLGYDDPREAPIVLRTVAMSAIMVTWMIVSRFTAGDAYIELKRRQLEKKKR